MRRFVALLLVVCVAAGALLGVRHEQRSSTKRVDVVFDTAKGMVAGQLVKIAGARAGTVDAVHLTRDHKARMQLRIDDKFLPFHADATCRILPEGPISENYVECDPGAKPADLATVDGTPTVAVAQTTAPVSIQDLLNVFAAPTQTRLALLINELGIGTAGRGEDINTILRRANPTLEQANALLAQINGQRGSLKRAIGQTDTVLADLAAKRQDVTAFVKHAATVTAITAAHRENLRQAIARLPALLTATRSGLAAINRATAAGTPLLADLQRSGPQLTALTTNLPVFAKAAVPAVKTVKQAAIEGRRTIAPTRRIARDLRGLGKVTPVIANLSAFLVSARDKGALENVQRVFYSLSALASLYNGVSHVLTLFAGVPMQCIALGEKARGCNHKFDSEANGRLPLNDPSATAANRKLLEALLGNNSSKKAPAATQQPQPASTPTPSEQQAATPSATAAPSATAQPLQQLQSTVEGLLNGVDGLLTPQDKQQPGDVTGLLDFLLK